MSRPDEAGMLWDDTPPPKIVKEKIVRLPPDPVWLRDDYLPWLEEANDYLFDLMTDREIREQAGRHTLVWDIEVYPNYFLLGFKSVETNKIIMFELNDAFEALHTSDREKLNFILRNYLFVGFNDTAFDLPVATASLAGYTTSMLMGCVNELILWGVRSWDFYRTRELEPPANINHIDLLELTPLAPSLKVAAGRLHAPRMQDLPFKVNKPLTQDQVTVLRWYWANDLDNTKLLYQFRKPEIDLRSKLTDQFGVDVRSKSDPQIAEAVLRKVIKDQSSIRQFKKAKIVPGRTFKYQPPTYLRYATPMMQQTLEFIRSQDFVVDEQGGPVMPDGIRELRVNIGRGVYNIGIGGLHSQEKCTIHYASDEYEITDNDVTSYYPSLILQQEMYPPNIGRVFLDVFEGIYHQRLRAKAAGDRTTADTLKIVLNGTFGKTGERGGYSIVYHPEMMIQVTVTGQLDLLLLIEMLELEDIEVISANTDGVMIKCRRSQVERKNEIIKTWERTTGLEMESTPYQAVYSRDVNNYIAFYDKPKSDKLAKAKGAYAFSAETGLKKNPTTEICTEAVIKFLAQGTPIEQTILECRDLRKFLEVRLVRGGACKNGEYLGKAVRWYYGLGIEDEIVNAKNGHNVPRSKGARPCMKLPTEFPEDINFDYYIQRAHDILDEFVPAEPKAKRKAA